MVSQGATVVGLGGIKFGGGGALGLTLGVDNLSGYSSAGDGQRGPSPAWTAPGACWASLASAPRRRVQLCCGCGVAAQGVEPFPRWIHPKNSRTSER